jgi:hypothetical protein
MTVRRGNLTQQCRTELTNGERLCDDQRVAPQQWLRHGKAFVPCVIWDISGGGARLAVGHSLADLPHDCEVVWTDARFVGVKFHLSRVNTRSARLFESSFWLPTTNSKIAVSRRVAPYR